MTTHKEALKLALEALEECRRDPRLKYEHPTYDKTITAIKEALAQPKQEPVAWMYNRARYGPTDLRGQQWRPELSRLKPYEGNGMVRDVTRLYTTPPQHSAIALKPLTDAQREEIAKGWRGRNWTVGSIIDAIEAAHGIKGDA